MFNQADDLRDTDIPKGQYIAILVLYVGSIVGFLSAFVINFLAVCICIIMVLGDDPYNTKKYYKELLNKNIIIAILSAVGPFMLIFKLVLLYTNFPTELTGEVINNGIWSLLASYLVNIIAFLAIIVVKGILILNLLRFMDSRSMKS